MGMTHKMNKRTNHLTIPPALWLLCALLAVSISFGCGKSPAKTLKGQIEDLTEIFEDNEDDPVEGIEELRSYMHDNLPDAMEAVGIALQQIVECDDDDCREELAEDWQEDLEEVLEDFQSAAQAFAEAVEDDDDAEEAMEEIAERYEAVFESLEGIMEGGGGDGPSGRARRETTTEATMNVRRLFDSSVSYYDSEHATMTGDIVPSQFPTSIGRTPAEVPCGEAVSTSYSDWSAPTWEALNFSVSGETRYSYQYESSGERIGATFTAYAFGDLDCDGELSTFIRHGVVEAGNEIRGGAGLEEINPEE